LGQKPVKKETVLSLFLKDILSWYETQSIVRHKNRGIFAITLKNASISPQKRLG